MNMSLIVSIVPLILVTFTNGAFVDPQYKLVEWQGWGTHLAWFADVLGGLDQTIQDEITRALFSPEELNLNIVRYVIGGTTPGDNSCISFRPGGASESFRDGPDKRFIWSRDSRTRRILLAAKQYGVDTCKAFSMSPPSWLTRNGCTNGNPEGAPLHDNFSPENANTFADYLTEVVKHYHDNYNLTFTTLVPMYEPSSGIYDGSHTREGCNIERTTLVDIIKSTYASIRAKNLSYCSISVAGEKNVDDELESQRLFNELGLQRYYSKVNTHSYTGSIKENPGELSTLTSQNEQKLWVGSEGFRSSNLQTMTQALNVADRIVSYLRNLLPSAWIYWDVVDMASSLYGFLSVPYKNATVENVVLNSGYYAMMHFSKYIKKGFSLVHANDLESVAAFDIQSETLIIVTVNAGSATTSKTFDLRRFSSIGEIHAFRTSALEPHVAIFPPTIKEKQFTFDFPSRSVTTLKVLGAGYIVTDTLIKNGDFETGGTNPWTLIHGCQEDDGINSKYWRGKLSGYLNLVNSKLALVQNVTISQNRTYYLSAWCATTGPSTILGVLINGQQGPETKIAPSEGYKLYGLSFDAQASATLSIYLQSEMGNHTAQIDDVVLH